MACFVSGGALKIKSLPSRFLCRFQKACVKYGVPDVDLFQTTDLFDRKNIALVTTTIFAVGRAVSLENELGCPFESILISFSFDSQTYRHPEWRGPYLGPRPSEENRREFSEDIMRAGENIIGLQAGTNRGANQSGLSIGATRKILLGK